MPTVRKVVHNARADDYRWRSIIERHREERALPDENRAARVRPDDWPRRRKTATDLQ